MVGHMLEIIMSLIAGQTSGWDVPLQEKKILIAQISSSLSMWMKILFPQAKLELQDYAQEPVHTLCTQWTPKLVPPWCTVWGDLRVPCRQQERRAGGWPWDYCSSCNANMAHSAAYLAQWPTGLTAHITLHTVFNLFPMLSLQGLL